MGSPVGEHMARTFPLDKEYDLRVHPYVPEEEQHDIMLKPPPWTVPMKRRPRGRDIGHFSCIYNSEGDFYPPNGKGIITKNKFKTLQDLQDTRIPEEKEDIKEEVSQIQEYKSFEDFMLNCKRNKKNVCNNDYTIVVPIKKINSCQGYFPDIIFPSNYNSYNKSSLYLADIIRQNILFIRCIQLQNCFASYSEVL